MLHINKKTLKTNNKLNIIIEYIVFLNIDNIHNEMLKMRKSALK